MQTIRAAYMPTQAPSRSFLVASGLHLERTLCATASPLRGGDLGEGINCITAQAVATTVRDANHSGSIYADPSPEQIIPCCVRAAFGAHFVRDSKSPPRRGFRGGYKLYNGASRSYDRSGCKPYGQQIHRPVLITPSYVHVCYTDP